VRQRVTAPSHRPISSWAAPAPAGGPAANTFGDHLTAITFGHPDRRSHRGRPTDQRIWALFCFWQLSQGGHGSGEAFGLFACSAHQDGSQPGSTGRRSRSSFLMVKSVSRSASRQ